MKSVEELDQDLEWLDIERNRLEWEHAQLNRKYLAVVRELSDLADEGDWSLDMLSLPLSEANKRFAAAAVAFVRYQLEQGE